MSFECQSLFSSKYKKTSISLVNQHIVSKENSVKLAENIGKVSSNKKRSLCIVTCLLVISQNTASLSVCVYHDLNNFWLK